MEGKQVVLVQGKLRKIVHQQGQGDTPQQGQEIFALYRGTLQNGIQFDSNQNRENPFSFPLGQGRVIKGWDQGFASMKKGEKATLICSPEYAYGARGSSPKIPANATLHFEVELLDFKDKKKQKWEYSDQEKIAQATNYKSKGNDKLKQGNYREAIQAYKQGIDFVEHETAADAKQLLNILRLNISQAYLKTNQYAEAIDNCTKVLKQESGNLKALYRRGLAASKSQDFAKAQTDFKELLRLDPQNAEAKKQLVAIAAAIRQVKQKEKKIFGNIFSKGGLYDDVKTEVKAKPEIKKVDSQSSDEEIKDEATPQPEPIEVQTNKTE